MNIKGFPPIVNENSRILILGTMPSIQSLRINQYYGNSRNQFWKLIYSLFNKQIDKTYEGRVKFLLNHYIALWDEISLN